MNWVILLLALGVIPFGSAYAQVDITVNATAPCWEDYSQTGIEYWQNCGAEDDYLQFALGPWEWVTGGLFSMIVVLILVLMTWIKYHNAILTIAIGVAFLPVAGFLFPDAWLSIALLLMGVAIGGIIWYIYVRQTKEY